MNEGFPSLTFDGRLRPSQNDVIQIAQEQLSRGERRLHVVAPPGTGKTVLGLYLWAHCIRKPAVVLSPNSAIQMQWAARTNLFSIAAQGDDQRDLVSTDPNKPGLLTSLTYQSVTMPQRGGSNLDNAAVRLWIENLLVKSQATDEAEASAWIADLAEKNPAYHRERLAAFRKDVRDESFIQGNALEMLHRSSKETLQRLQDSEVGLIILDECHHLMGHWGRVLADAFNYLGQPIVVGLTATPPDLEGKDRLDVERYQAFFGPIDYEVPVPAVVKDGFLAPYQDLAYFVRPTSDELHYIANVDRNLRELVRKFTDPLLQNPLPQWIYQALVEKKVGINVASDWRDFVRRDVKFADAARVYLHRLGTKLPEDVPALDRSDEAFAISELELLGTVMDRYIRHCLRRSENEQDKQLAREAISGLRLLGIQITETGSQPCASPVSRVMAYSLSKCEAIRKILTAEHQELKDQLRAVVVADFEKSSAISAEISHLMDEEVGGAIAAFKALLDHESTDLLDPILVTGSSVLLDDDVASKIVAEAEVWLAERGYHVELTLVDYEGFKLLKGAGSDWSPKVYVELITDLFQRGLTQCLVGTRGLLGEGWDANRINVLVDLTCVTTSMTVNQLRGRSIRLDPTHPEKVANNWDVVCVAAEFAKGLDDYHRFCKKHKSLFGVTDDAAIEKGVGHVHASFTEIRPEGIEGTVSAINSEMLSRVSQREETRERWKIGQPYHPEPVKTLEVKMSGGGGGFPPFAGSAEPWSRGSLTAAIAEAVLGSMQEVGLIKQGQSFQLNEREGDYLRVFLADASEEDARTFSIALKEAIGPIDRPRYVIPRSVDYQEETLLSRLLPEVVGRYFRKNHREMVMLHCVPSELAKHRDLVKVYEKHWSKWVSPGEALYAHRGSGADLLDRCSREGILPNAEVRSKEVFLSKSDDLPDSGS